jgi:hypothetical protein
MNERKYNAHLAELELNNPGEPLLQALRGGWSKINVLYMGIALKRMPTVLELDEEEMIEVKTGTRPGKPIVAKVTFKNGTPDDTLRQLWAERGRLFGQMNRQSNEFHKCKTDADRVGNSAKVLGWWKDILRVKGNILHYEEYGELPKVAQQGDELSDNAVALGKQLASIRAKISQTKAKITELAGLDPNTPGKEGKILEYEQKLRELIHNRGLAEQKLKSHEQEG